MVAPHGSPVKSWSFGKTLLGTTVKLRINGEIKSFPNFEQLPVAFPLTLPVLWPIIEIESRSAPKNAVRNFY
jgi:hypothetical protein